MVGMFLANVFYTKIIDNQCEADRARDVFPQAWGVGNFIVTMFCLALLEEPVSKDACLGQSIHCSSNFHIDITIFCFFTKIVLLDNMLLDILQWHSHVFIPVHWCSKIKEFQVRSNAPGIFSADDTIPHYF